MNTDFLSVAQKVKDSFSEICLKGIKMANTDIFGMMFMDYLRTGQDARYGIRRDDGYFEWDNVRGYFAEYDEFGHLIQEALKKVGNRVLDVGCGTGKHSLYLQRIGVDVVGLDVSPLAIQVCNERGVKRCVVASASDLPFKTYHCFDTIIMMGNNFGICGTVPETKRMLVNFHKIVSDGGIILAHAVDPTLTSNPAHLAYHERNRKLGLPIGQVKVRLEYNDSVSQWFYLLLVTPEEMRKLAEETGWKFDEVITGQDASFVGVLKKYDTDERG